MSESPEKPPAETPTYAPAPIPEALPPSPAFLEACEALGFELSEEQLHQLGLYLALLLDRNKQFNLTAVKDPEVGWMRHIFDSLTLWPFAMAGATLADVGTGGGLPGIPLAIVCPHLEVTLMEATNKKCNFLREVRDVLGIRFEVRWGRAEDLGQERDLRERFDLVCARGVARLPTLLEFLMPLCREGGMVLAMKGRRAQEELDESEVALSILGAEEVDVHTFDEEGDLTIIEIHKGSSTPPKYPRATGLPKKFPL